MSKFFSARALALALVVTGTTAAACSIPSSSNPGIEVRVENRSPYDFDRVVVTFPDGEQDYGRVPRGVSSAYRRVEKAYGYALVEATAGGETYRFQPQDFLGEKTLEPGRYTYVLTVDETEHQLGLRLVEN